MFKNISEKLLDQTGAMDKILVTLLFVVIGVGAVVGLTSWGNTQKNSIKTEAVTKIDTVVKEQN